MKPDYETERVKLYCADCLDVLPILEAGSMDLTVTSPPYGNLRDYKGYTFDFEGIARELYRVTKPGGVVVWIVGDETQEWDESGESFRQALYFKFLGFKMETMIYEKDGFRFPFDDRYHQTFEFMFIFAKDNKPKTFNPIEDRKVLYNSHGPILKRERDGSTSHRKTYYSGKSLSKRYNIWRYSSGGSKSTNDNFAYGHPAIFPEALARDHILSWSNPDDVILDPMMGSGTTGKMAMKLGRKFIGIECSSEYFNNIAIRRIEQAERQPALIQV